MGYAYRHGKLLVGTATTYPAKILSPSVGQVRPFEGLSEVRPGLVVSVLLTETVFFAFLRLFGHEGGPLLSLIGSCMAALIAIYVLWRLLLKAELGSKALVILLAAFGIRSILG